MKQGTKVMVYFDETGIKDQEGTIVGVASENPLWTNYIVQFKKPLSSIYPYTCLIIPDSFIDILDEGVKGASKGNVISIFK